MTYSYLLISFSYLIDKYKYLLHLFDFNFIVLVIQCIYSVNLHIFFLLIFVFFILLKHKSFHFLFIYDESFKVSQEIIVCLIRKFYSLYPTFFNFSFIYHNQQQQYTPSAHTNFCSDFRIHINFWHILHSYSFFLYLIFINL